MYVLSRAVALCLLLAWIMIPAINFASEEEKVDINTAPLESLIKIVHIGEARAIELISLRPFISLNELSRINGISELRVEDIKSQGMAFVETERQEELPTKEVYQESPENVFFNEEIKITTTKTKKPYNYLFVATLIALISATLILLIKKNVKIK